MATTLKANRRDMMWWAFWLAFVAASLGFLYDSLVYAVARDHQAGATVLNRLAWYVAHVVVASPILLVAPFQFMPGLRQARPELHRWLGRYFLASCLVAAPLGVWLGATIEYTGSRIPMTLLGSLWFFFAITAWQAARQRDFVTHRRFAIRTFSLGAAFVWVRMISEVQDDIFGFMVEEAVRETTKEWLTLVLPILVTELWLTWGPAARKLFRAR